MPDIIGQSLGRYHILEQLGEGGMATVYKAYDTRLERYVAIKVILPWKEHSEKFQARFEREAKALAALSHPNILKVLDYGEQDSLTYLVMEYFPGGTLKQILGKPIPWQEVARLLLPIARALEYAHREKIIHRDVKPANILMTQSGDPMLSDFGISKMLESEETVDLTGTGVGLGTPDYMAPEQGLGQNVDYRADLYAMGVIFYEMITGRKPYRADTPMAVLLKKATEPLPRPSQFVPDLPESVENFLLKTLARDPANRYQSAGEIITVLEGLLVGKHSHAPVLENGKKEFRKRNRQLFWLLGGAGILFLAVLYVLVGVIALPQLLGKPASSPSTGVILSSPTLASQTLLTSTYISMPTNILLSTATSTLTPTNQGSWDQGRIVYLEKNSINRHDMYLLDLAAGSAPKLLLSPTTNQEYYGPSLSPDSSKVVYYNLNGNNGILDLKTLTVHEFSACNSPSFSADGSQIICGGGNQFLILNTSGAMVDSLHVGMNNAALPAWSPDGSEVAFAAFTGKATTIWKISSSGGQAIPLASEAYENYGPTWSPDGQWIAYQAGDGSGYDDVWIMDQNGGNKRQVTTTSGGWSRAPIWSPDGKWLAFVSRTDRSVASDYGDVFAISLQSGEIVPITHTGERVLDWRVSWAP